jgi:GT2 family glycosyltransferase
MKNLSVIIVTYNGMRWIKKCIESVLNSSVISEIIIVDNNSSDETTDFIKENFPQIILFEQSKNLGFGLANNIGMSYALNNDADFVFLLNQDAYLQYETLSNLIKVHALNEDYAILSPIHLNGNGSKLDKNFSGYLKVNDKLIFDSLHKDYSQKIYNVPFVNAAAWLLPCKTLEIIGGFDPIFYHYGEDDNYCQRVLFHNMKIGIVPTTSIYHDRDSEKPPRITQEKEKLALKERYFKYKWANINVEAQEDIENKKKDLLILIIKLYCKFKFKKANYYKKELALIKRITTEVFQSRSINSQIGNHYL